MYNMDISIGSYKLRLEILILIVIVSWILFGHLLCGCSKVSFMEGMAMMKEGLSKSKEGFTGANNVAYGPEFAGAKTPDYIMNPSTWAMPTLTYSPGSTPNAAVQSILDRPKQPIPLPKGELDMFATTPFKPECCPNTYSNSMGCACMDMNSYKYLIERGGNNVPYDIY